MESPNVFSGKRILLGVTGSIAAYKAVDILRRLSERGAEVHVVMTKNAERFIPRLTFEVLSRKPVFCEEFSDYNRAAIGHIEFTDSLDLALLAPATANIIGKIASGIADDALTSALMAVNCPLLIAPAMNERMYRNPILQKNIHTLKGLGVRFVDPGIGNLACGVTGQGRLADTDQILAEASALLSSRDLEGRTFLITAGPTREHIDAVRFISNPSSGKMGYALATAARDRGADVILISGPTALVPPRGVKMINVISAQQMHDAVMAQVDLSHVVIMSAAVSDFRPIHATERKIKKQDAPAVIQLERTDDILLKLGRAGGNRLLVGFAAETDDVEQNAIKKLKEKNLDLIIVNDLLKTGAGFGTDTNAVTILDRSGKKVELPTMSKSDIAAHILCAIRDYQQQKNTLSP
jgi:phosphopantothenoylcysteine decarboxylase / phosphopantothenate---cysteine ligase